MNISYYVIQFLIFVYPVIFVFYQLFLYKLSFSRKDNVLQSSINSEDLPSLSIIVPTKGEKISIIQGLIDNVYQLIWDKRKMEVIVVSDDNEDYFNEMVRSVRIPNDLDVKFFRREKKLGFKSGALLYGYEKSKGDLILTLDVDSRLPKDALIRAYHRMIANNCDVVALQWIGYSENMHSRLAKGLMASTFFASKALFEGKEVANLVVFPVGSGTLFKRSSISAVNGWDYTLIQDDLEIGARLIKKNKKICSAGVPIYIEVPDNFFSFYIQQTRWAMGTGEVLRNRIKYILTANVSIKKKVDAILHLLQYTPIIFTFIGSLVLILLIPWLKSDPMHTPLILVWAFFLALYAIVIYNIAIKLGFTKRDAIFSIGRVSAFTVAISPFVTYAFFKGILSKNKVYIVTPKGSTSAKKETKIIALVGLFGILYLTFSIISFIIHYYVTFLWYLYYAFGYIYTLIGYNREL